MIYCFKLFVVCKYVYVGLKSSYELMFLVVNDMPTLNKAYLI